MSEVKDRREDIVNQLVMWAIRHGIDLNEAKNDFYMMLGNVEIMSRSTEIAATEENQNEYWLKKFLVSKKVAGRTDRTIQFYARECTKALERIGKPVEKITADDIYNAANYIFAGKPTYSILATEDTLNANKEYFEKIAK